MMSEQRNTRITLEEAGLKHWGTQEGNTGGEHRRGAWENIEQSDKDKRENKDHTHTHTHTHTHYKGLRCRWSELAEGQVGERNGKTLEERKSHIWRN